MTLHRHWGDVVFTPCACREGCARATLFFHACVCACIRHLSIYPSCYFLLNHWAEFNQTCYITSPYGKGVPEQHYFSVRPSSVHLSIALSPPKTTGWNLIKLATSLPLMVRVCKSNIFFVCVCVHLCVHLCLCHPSIMLSPPKDLNHWVEFN